jgi:hypothetical protein
MTAKRKHPEIALALDLSPNDKESSGEPPLSRSNVKDYPRKRVAIAVCNDLKMSSLSNLWLRLVRTLSPT